MDFIKKNPTLIAVVINIILGVVILSILLSKKDKECFIENVENFDIIPTKTDYCSGKDSLWWKNIIGMLEGPRMSVTMPYQISTLNEIKRFHNKFKDMKDLYGQQCIVSGTVNTFARELMTILYDRFRKSNSGELKDATGNMIKLSELNTRKYLLIQDYFLYVNTDQDFVDYHNTLKGQNKMPLKPLRTSNTQDLKIRPTSTVNEILVMKNNQYI
jgi:hypothetical protein